MYVFCTAFCYYFSRSELLCWSWERLNENMFNNHRGIGVAGILWLKQQLTHQCREASIMVWCSLPWGVWLGCEPALVCFCHSAPVLCLSLSLFSLSSRSLSLSCRHTLIHSPIHSFTLLLPSSLRLAAHSKQNGIWCIWKACCSAREYQCTQWRLSPGCWVSPIPPNWQAVENNNDFHWKTHQTDDLKRNRLCTVKSLRQNMKVYTSKTSVGYICL